MGINKVIYGNNVIIDLTDSTVTPGVLLEGYTAYDASGKKITGTLILDWEDTPATIVAVRSYMNFNSSTGTMILEASNTEAVLMSTQQNDYSFVDRNGYTDYLLPVDPKAKKVIVSYSGSRTMGTYRYQGFKDNGGTFTRVFDSGKISNNTYSFAGNTIDYIVVSMELSGSNWPWEDTQTASLKFTN